ncbi:uncharacterized protein EDB91DRAFT_1036445, partial [Suillus paluster]|uniref:uncharacterized protein n=1 Tax=Suillus paluster TaxID=48578 RepID=UPI001B877DB8
LSCHRCSQSRNRPSNILLECGSCKRGWHHKCHIPPVEDTELIRRIRSTIAGDHDNGLAGWRCKRCKKNQ